MALFSFVLLSQKLIKELPSLVPSEDDKVENQPRLDSPDSSMAPTETMSVGAEQDHGDKTGEVASVDESQQDVAGGFLSQHSNPKEELGKNPGEIAFFKLLHAEFKKASHFFDKAQQEFAIREERVREGMEIMKRPNSIMVNEKWPLVAKSIYRLYKDLLLLETFAIMTYCSFSKILKKHDKVTGHDTRIAFMTNVVSQANFTTYPKVLEMINRCETLYADVSERLLQEGKEGLYEDERLFINMISRLNEQALETSDAPERADGQVRRPSHVAVIKTGSVQIKPESRALSEIRSLVEENDNHVSAEVSEGHVEVDSDRSVKRPRVE
jgi:SPX domain